MGKATPGRRARRARASAIGKDHFAAKLSGLGVAQETFHYQRAEFEHGGLPYLAEVAFGYCPDGLDPRRIITGVNWSVAIGADPFRHLARAAKASTRFSQSSAPGGTSLS
jgi:hypothetical protein